MACLTVNLCSLYFRIFRYSSGFFMAGTHSKPSQMLFAKITVFGKSHILAGLNISNGDGTMSDKKSSYVQKKNCFRAKLKQFLISYWPLKTHKHSISIGLSCTGFFKRHIWFFIFKAVMCVRVKRFYTNTSFFFSPAWDSLSSQNFFMSSHNTKNL